MSHSINAVPTPKRRNATALVSALLAVAALMAMASGTASAANNFACEPGEFCLWRLYNFSGGLYQATGDDPDLRDNLFYYYTDPAQNETLGRVSQNSYSAKNLGYAGTYKDVMVYTWFSYTGHKACIKNGKHIGDLGSWRNRINSLRWVTRAECDTAGQLGS
jgi:hypothetical protein